MKINCLMFSPPHYRSGLHKIMKIMKLTALLLLAATLQVSARTYSQKKVTVDFNNIPLTEALRLLERKTDYRFVYSNLVLAENQKVSFSAKNLPLETVLDSLLLSVNMQHRQISGNLIAIRSLLNNTFQDITIKGRVTDSKGSPLSNVSVFNDKGEGVYTNENGEYAIAASENGKLTFSYVGFVSQSIQIKGQTTISISLQASNNELSDVVVVGYGTQSRRKITGAVSTVSGETLNQRVATNPATLLQGQLPGLQVIQGSGEPGAENVNFRIRGVGTFSGAGSTPLIIVDGLPGSITALNPNDIESISVLKDAASAAIYGSRGANGVIVVKTKKGGNGFSLSYNYNLGITNATSLPDVITNSAEYMELYNEARTNSGLQPQYTQAQIDLYRNATDRVLYPNYNWMNDLFKTAIVQNHYLNLSGGKDGTSYHLGIGLTDQPGTMIGFDFKKYTLDFGLSSKINKRITIGSNIQMQYGNKNNPRQGAGDQFLSTLAQSPLYPPRAPDGRWIKRAFPNEQGNKNSIAIVHEGATRQTETYYLQGNLNMEVQLFKGLSWETRAGANYSAGKFNDFRPTVQLFYYNDMSPAGNLDVGSPGLEIGRDDNIYTVFYSQLNYKRSFGEHAINGFAGYQEEHNVFSNVGAFRNQYTTNLLRELNAGPTAGMTNSGTSNEWALRSYYGNVNYDYQDKYLIGFSLRNDGTSRLPSSTRRGWFYSASAAWRLSNENFLMNVKWLNDLKIRASYGKLGNQNIGIYPYQATLQNRDYVFNGAVQPGYSASTLVDPSLIWESSSVFDIGLDLTAFNNKLTVTADWYNKYTYDILRTAQIPLWVGLNPPTINNGAVRDKGFELAIQYRDQINKDLGYFIGGNIQRYRNSLEDYGSTDIFARNIRKEGMELDAYYLYQWDGIFQSQDEIDKSPTQPVTPRPGDLKIRDIDGNGIINDQDRTRVDGKYPSFQYAMNMGLTFRQFDFSAQLYGSAGQKIYVNGWGIEPFRQGSLPTTDWRNRWTPDNPSQTMPRIYVADGYAPVQSYASTYFLKEASFMRLKNIQLGYTLPGAILKKLTMKSARLYFTADNVFTISKFPGLDPERVGDGNYVTYPQLRTFTFGAMVQF